MKKLFALVLAVAMLLSVASVSFADNTVIDKLTVYFVPSASVEDMMTASEPLKQMLIDELAKSGFDPSM